MLSLIQAPRGLKLIWNDFIYILAVKIMHLLRPVEHQRFQLGSYSEDFSFKKGVNNIISNQFLTLQLCKTWIT